jgi:hypothetical protein
VSVAGRIDEIWPDEVEMTFSERKRDHGKHVRSASGRQRGSYNDDAVTDKLFGSPPFSMDTLGDTVADRFVYVPPILDRAR